MNANPTTTRAVLTATLALTVAVSLTACGGADSTQKAEQKTTASGEVSVKNCGNDVTLAKPAEKILALHPAMTEMVVAAGGKDKLIGQMWTKAGYPDGEYAAEVKAVKSVSDAIASQEEVLALKPDLIVASGDFWFDGKRMAKLDDLKKSGIAVFINSSACGDTATAKVADAFGDLTNLGTLLGTEDATKKVTKKYQDKLAATQKTKPKARPGALIQLYQGDAYAYDGGIYSDVLTLAGVTNTFSGELPEGKRFGKVSTEAVLAKNPEVLLVNTAMAGKQDENVTSAKKTFAGVKAVKGDAVHPVSELGFVGGLGAVRAVETIAELMKKP